VAGLAWLTCLGVLGQNQARQPSSSPRLAAALEEFRNLTSGLGTAANRAGNRGGGTDAAGSAGRSRQQAQGSGVHGRIFENFRNDALDAIPHEIVQRGMPQRKLRRNQFGANITGPVVLPKIYDGTGKTYFTFTFEAMRESIGQSRLLTIPTTLERTGQFGHVVDISGQPLPIYDPSSTAVNPNYDAKQAVSTANLQYLRQLFPGNVIPLSRLDPVAQAALDFLPQPNTNAGPFFRNNYFPVQPVINRATGFIISLDHSFLSRHRVSLNLNRSVGTNGNNASFPTIADSANAPVDAITRGLKLEHIFTQSAANINTWRFTASAASTLNQVAFDSLGRPFPRYEIAGYESMGRNNPVSNDIQTIFQLEDTFASRYKTHRLSMGADLLVTRDNSYRPRDPQGLFNFTAGLTSLPGIINTGHGFASFLLGQAAFARKSLIISPSYFSWLQQRYVFNDQWQVTKSLTITLGANLEIRGGRREKYDRQSSVDLRLINPANGRPGALAIAGINSEFGRSLQPLWVKVEPSVNLAWNVLGDNNTVVRLSVQRRYDDRRIQFNQFGTQAFNGNPTWLSSNEQLSPAVSLSDGLNPSQRFPDLRLDAANGTVADIIDMSPRQPTRTQYDASLQRQLAPFLIATAEYHYENSRNQYIGDIGANPNAVRLEALAFRDQLNNLDFVNSFRPYPQYQNFNVGNMYPDGRSRQHNITFRLEKRTSGGLALNMFYQHRRRFDDFSFNVQDFHNRNNEWARSGFLSPHSFNINYIYELPFGPKRQFLKGNGLLGQIIGGWAVSGNTGWNSGNPMSFQAQFNNTGGVVQFLRASEVPGVDPRVQNQGPSLWFNPKAFVQPENFQLGTSKRTYGSILAPSFRNSDINLNKRIAFGNRTLEFSASAFNFDNHANWNGPDNRIGPASAPNVNAGKIIGSFGGRIIQLGLRLNF
jgi:hypothetical protein